MELKTAVVSDVKTLQDSQAEIGKSINKINTDMQKGVNQYQLDEVSQLLRLANNSVLFGTDTDSAINALSLADNLLKSLSDPRYVAVRTRISQEISLLRNVEQVDLESVSGTLHSIAQSIPSLPLANEPEEQKVDSTQTAVADSLTWRTELRKLWQDILSSIQVQRVDQPPKPLLVPQQRYFLNQNLQLLLAKAELALLLERPRYLNAAFTIQ